MQNGRLDNVRYAVGMNKTTLGNEILYKTKMNQDVECNWPGGIFGRKKGKRSYENGKRKNKEIYKYKFKGIENTLG